MTLEATIMSTPPRIIGVKQNGYTEAVAPLKNETVLAQREIDKFDNSLDSVVQVNGDYEIRKAEEFKSIPSSNLFSLNERTILVTGGGRGLGIVIATALLEAGADVACLDLLPQPDEEAWTLASTIARNNSNKLTYYPVDITNEKAHEDVLDSILTGARHPLRGAVCCAGVTQEIPATDYPPQEFQRILNVNTVGTFITARLTARALIKQGTSGSIVLVASMSGSIANRSLSCVAYNSSKAAVHQMCRSLAAEWSTIPNTPIRVNTISPGYIRTKMTDQLLRDKPSSGVRWFDGCMLNRLAEPEEFRAPLIFLLSDGSSFMTGSDLRVDGGYCAW